MFKLDEKLKNERLGLRKLNNQGVMMEIIEYNTANNITVKFVDSGFIKYNTTWRYFNKGEVRDVFFPTVYNHGYLGDGCYKTRVNGKPSKCYKTWSDMLKRCYSERLHKKFTTYIGCTVIDSWLNFQNFSKWFDQNYYEVDDEVMELDKDILVKGNKIYSPDTCVFVPQKINLLFVNRKNKRGNLPLGVYRKSNKYVAQCNIGEHKQINLGYFDNYTDAFKAYKTYKESYIKKVANDYKCKIPDRLYLAMINYQIEILD